MEYRILGRTGLRASAIAFGAGPVSGLMTGDDSEQQLATVHQAIQLGINWFDTAPGYGQGRSEAALGRCFRELQAVDSLHAATKYRFQPPDFSDITGAVRRSVEESLARLGLDRITLLQLHNGITQRRGDEPDSISPDDVLRSGGVLDAFRAVQSAGLVQLVGLTGTGQPDAMKKVIHSGEFDTMQTPYNLLNPSAGQVMSEPFEEFNYGNIIADCTKQNMGVFAIRVFAGGAALGRAPSAHTLQTKYFPLSLYQRDLHRSAILAESFESPVARKRAAIRFALTNPQIHSAIIGFGKRAEVQEAIELCKPILPS